MRIEESSHTRMCVPASSLTTIMRNYDPISRLPNFVIQVATNTIQPTESHVVLKLQASQIYMFLDHSTPTATSHCQREHRKSREWYFLGRQIVAVILYKHRKPARMD